jgi:outer membrane protein assembly factor BamB
VYAIAVQVNVVYLGGRFTRLRNPATDEWMAAGGLAALNRNTGEPIWTATANGDVRSLAVAADGSAVFAGGDFTTVNGTAADRLVALAPATGKPISSWHASASGTVRDLLVSGSDLYAAGRFGRMNGAGRAGLARLDVASGAVQPWKAPTAGGRPWALSLSADGQRLIVAGDFTALAGAARTYLGSVSTVTGQATAWNPAPVCAECKILDVDTDSAATYVGTAGTGGHLAAYANDTGRQLWSKGADGDVQAVAVEGGLVYAGGHFVLKFAGTSRRQLAAVKATTGAVDAFAPQMLGNTHPGVWALVAEPDALFVGGGFTGVSTAPEQEGYAKFPSS